MIDDLVSIDPKKIATVSPRVVIENAFSRIGKQTEINVPLSYDTSKQLEIGEGVRNLEIEYAGLSFTNPEALRYVYKLEGLDTDWIDAGNRRTAFYPYLPPGTYHFVVRALSANGVWSETASMQVRVAEYFWESRWFASMVFIVVAGLLGLVFWNRLRHLRERQERRAEFARQIIFASEQERRRIATDLHDGLSQNLLLVKNWARLAIEKATSDNEASFEYMDRINSLAAESINETRTIIENLVPQNLHRLGLTEAIINITEQVQDAFGVFFEKDVENIDGLLDDESELSVYRMTQECVNNIIKHSESPRGSILIRKDAKVIVVRVSDFGIGIRSNGSRGSGLRNLEERAELLGGSIEIDSRIDEGTKITIRVPYQV